MPVTLTLFITKSAARMSRIFGRGDGGALPGLMAERLDPTLGTKLAAKLPHGVILVTGTNGKTTTTKLIAAALEASGERVLTNRTGSNLRRGVLSSFIKAASITGKIDATIGLFEVDEAWLRHVAADLQPRQIVVTNLFRDQLDRYGELDTTAALIGHGIAATTAHVYLNADDPLVASLAKYAARPELVSYFGIEGLPSHGATAYKTAIDSDHCPSCGDPLVFSRTFYGHIGHYRCPRGDFSRPQPDVALVSVEESTDDATSFTVALDGKRHTASINLPGTYNLYNALATLALGHGIGIADAVLIRSIQNTAAAFGRLEKVLIDGKTLYVLLVKNPAGFTQVIETFLVRRKHPEVMMIINDHHADGRDVSWLWDVPMEALAPNGAHVVATGIRGSDMALRLKYAGVETEHVDGLDSALDALLKRVPDGGTGFVLPTYTSMIEIRNVLAKRTQMERIKV